MLVIIIIQCAFVLACAGLKVLAFKQFNCVFHALDDDYTVTHASAPIERQYKLKGVT